MSVYYNLKTSPMYATEWILHLPYSCPDGTCALVAADDRSLSLFVIPSASTSTSETWTPLWNYKPPDALLSYEWFPGATSSSPPYFAFIVAVKDHPVQLLDAGDCSLRASYPIIDHQERFVAPHSMVFTGNGEKLICGYESAIEIFDVSSPGSAGLRIATSPSRNSRSGQKGIISSLAINADSSILVAGSFSGTIGLYDCVNDWKLIKVIRLNERGGVTQVHFHPMDHLLYIASRLSRSIEVLDMRKLNQPPGRYRRRGRTNQRLGFDVEPSGTWLVAGDVTGRISFYSAEFDAQNAQPVFSFQAAKEPIGSCVYIPGSTQLLTCSGSRRFNKLNHDSSSSSSGEGEAIEVEPVTREDSLKLWNQT